MSVGWYENGRKWCTITRCDVWLKKKKLLIHGPARIKGAEADKKKYVLRHSPCEGWTLPPPALSPESRHAQTLNHLLWLSEPGIISSTHSASAALRMAVLQTAVPPAPTDGRGARPSSAGSLVRSPAASRRLHLDAAAGSRGSFLLLSVRHAGELSCLYRLCFKHKHLKGAATPW